MADEADGRSLAAGMVAGVTLKPWLDIEGELVFPDRRFTKTYGGDTISQSSAPPGSPDFERLGVSLEYHKERDYSMNISSVAIFHGPFNPRVEVGLVAGVTSQRFTDRSTYTPVRVGDGIAPDHYLRQTRSEVNARHILCPTFGAIVDVAVTRHLRIVPDIRFDYGSLGDEINNVVRTSVRINWRF